jgi:hypothetical protein
MKLKFILITLTALLLVGCGVRVPDDFEYNLRTIADTNEELLERIEDLPAERREAELRNIVEQDIVDFRNAAATVEAGR